ncbi:MAG TPA: hypothetical protein VF278_20660 [Pirellulales bacterium]
MIDPRLSQQLEKVAIRIRRLRFWRGLAAVWLLSAGTGVLLAGMEKNAGWQLPQASTAIFTVALALAAYLGWKAHRSCRDYQAVAERLEAGYPELQSCLRTALEQRPLHEGWRFSFLQDRVIRQALNHAYRHNWPSLVPGRRIAAAIMASGAAFALMLFVLAGLDSTAATARRPATLQPESAATADDLTFTVEPGDTEVERGSSLLVLARFQGPQPTGATLVYGAPHAETTAGPIRLNMAKSLDDPVFGERIAAVDGPLDYHVEMAEKSSRHYHVAVFEYPKLLRADARLVYPDYTGSDERLIEDVRTVSAVEGTELTLLCHLNKPVASASLAEADQPPLVLEASPSDERLRQVTLKCVKSRKLRLDLVDEQGRKNKARTVITIKVLPNQPPDLKLAFPARDIEVSPLEEADIKATAWDDFGLRRFGLTYELAGGEPVEVVLGENAAAKKRQELAHVIKLEDLKAQPDQLLAYHFWAEDFAADGQLRRTQSDMYFAEVRPFDEIFRQGQPPPGGAQGQQSGGANAQAAEKLLQLQKDIINATWKVIRREAAAASGKLPDDAKSIGDSQTAAQEQAEQAKQKLTDAKSQAHAAEAIDAMRKAVEQLTAAHAGNAAEPLRPALAAEQAAYQALLKLRAREHSVVRGQQQGGGGGGANRSQRQLQELELRNDENRYETQRAAQSQPPEERETRQVLNRLSELARRQNDLNQRLKELQSALEEAETEPEREEIRRQLKRLREEQEDVLRDTDELKSRMDEPENRERMADAREQLDETRENVRRAGEALADENVSRAAAAGTRAERDFQQLRNDFRRRAAGQFSDEMRQMRDDARQLDENERQISRTLADENERGGEKSLRDDGASEKLPDELARQRQRLNELLERMRETIDAAETPEPLLAERLYETARKSQEQSIERVLEAAELSTRRGLADDAREQEELAGQGIRNLREGIERAAESVLGDETEALRRAREELKRLTDEVSEELARNMEPGAEASEGSGVKEQGSGFRVQGSGKTESEPRANARQRDDKDAARPEDAQGEDRGGPQAERGENSPAADAQAGRGESNRGQNTRGQSQAGETGRQRGEKSARGRASAQRLTGGANDSSASGGSDERFDVGARGRAPIGGDDFRDWSDRLRDVEEMIDDPELSAQAARVRQRAKAIRGELKRHSHEPNWKLVKIDVARPLAELRDRVAAELLRRTAQDALAPLDRDPVPPKYQEKTRRYYERLGSGR